MAEIYGFKVVYPCKSKIRVIQNSLVLKKL